jgi:predicted nucleic acid-binding protein
MRRYVVDASVAVKWFVPEIHSAEALRLLSSDCELLAPDLLPSELGNIRAVPVRTCLSAGCRVWPHGLR